MKIGLTRHFRVLHPSPPEKLVRTAVLLQWFKDYDEAEIENLRLTCLASTGYIAIRAI